MYTLVNRSRTRKFPLAMVLLVISHEKRARNKPKTAKSIKELKV